MIQRLSHVTLYVLDQDAALQFYTEKLGFEVRDDHQVGPFRWLTIAPKGQSDLQIILMPIVASPMLDEASVGQLRALVQRGAFGAGIFLTTDIQSTHADLKAKGVQITSPPSERPYGIEMLIKDNSGNWFSVVQRPS